MFTKLIEIKKNVYAVRHSVFLTNSYIVRSENGVYLIDAGVYANGSDMLWALRKLGISVDELKGILLTHWHNDHTGGASAIQKISSATVYYNEMAKDYYCGNKKSSF